MSATQTYMYVRSTASLPKTPPYEVMVESEKVTVTAVTMPSWYYRLAIVRGAGGTTAATHPNYSMVASGAAYGAPHVDINTLAMDANGGLLMGAHGGIFLLPDPDSASSTTSNTWLSKNGNLGVSEMHDVAYDHVTDTLVGSNQDNCVVYQSAPGSLIWPVGPGYQRRRRRRGRGRHRRRPVGPLCCQPEPGQFPAPGLQCFQHPGEQNRPQHLCDHRQAVHHARRREHRRSQPPADRRLGQPLRVAGPGHDHQQDRHRRRQPPGHRLRRTQEWCGQPRRLLRGQWDQHVLCPHDGRRRGRCDRGLALGGLVHP